MGQLGCLAACILLIEADHLQQTAILIVELKNTPIRQPHYQNSLV